MPVGGGPCAWCDRVDSHIHSHAMGAAGAGFEAHAADATYRQVMMWWCENVSQRLSCAAENKQLALELARILRPDERFVSWNEVLVHIAPTKESTFDPS